MRRLMPLLLAGLLACFAASTSTWAPVAAHKRPAAYAAKADWNKQLGWVTVPVFYVTDRTLVVSSGELDYSELQRTDGLSYGVKNITIPLTAHLNNYSNQLKAMGWHILPNGENQNKFLDSGELMFPNRTYNRDEFFQALTKAVALLLKMLDELDVLSLNISPFYFDDAVAIHATGVEACRDLLALTKTTTYPYLGEGEPVLMYEGQQQSEIADNLRTLLVKLVTEYQQFLKANGLQFLGEHWFDQSLMVFFVLKKRHDGTITYDEHFVDYPGDGARIRVVDSNEVVDLTEYWDTHTINIKNEKHNVRFSTHRAAPMQLFTRTPLTELLSRMLNDDIRDYFKDKADGARMASSN